MNRFFILIGVVIVLGLAWFIFSFDDSEETGLETDTVEFEETGSAVRRNAALPKAQVPEVEAEQPRMPEKVKAPAKKVGEGIELSGRVLVIDPDGAKHESEDGKFDGSTWSGSKGVPFSVTVKEGRWTANVVPGDTISFRNIIMGGKAAYWDSQPISIPESQELDLEFNWVEGFMLHVVDRQSRQELPDVDIMMVRNSSIEHPGFHQPKNLLVNKQNSPVSIEGFTYIKNLVVRARGYAWKSVRLAPKSPKDLTVLLDREAKLRVTIVGDELPAKSRLRIGDYPVKIGVAEKIHGTPLPSTKYGYGTPYLDSPLRGKRQLELDGLVPGVARVRVEIGHWHANPVALGGVYAHLIEGETASVEISLDTAALGAEGAPLSGTFEIHPSWTIKKKPRLTIRPMKGKGKTTQQAVQVNLIQVEGETHRWNWDAGTMLPGHYEALVHSHEQHNTFELPKEGLRGLAVRIGAQTTIEVTVLKPDGTKVLDGTAFVTWNGVVPSGVWDYSSNGVSFDSESKCFKIKCPEGPTQVSASLEGYESVSEVVDARAPKTELTLILKPTQGVKIILQYNKAIIPVDWEFEISLFNQDGSHADRKSSMSDGNSKTEFVDPGSYVVRFGTLEGYKAIEKRSVDIRPGEIAELVIELKKDR